ncbi:6-bladed beta-propeller [Oryzomonas japonica]|uniref:6-bladed beta-propeller n=1 Tax=Oryzomonas japonica TaxID=2603858 RepID=A0A7J4ZP10_9BACT|nr:6-bladed beta-propeller [Oryzomonas japonica]KAB0664484.1 6-bladed beta-propeller [Oryzomonas japonica]
MRKHRDLPWPSLGRFVGAACCAAALVCIMSACATRGTLYSELPPNPLQWPQKAYGPRVQWVKSIANYHEAGITKSFWKRVWELVAGEDTRSIVRPYGIFFDDKERLFVVDVGSATVHAIDIGAGLYTIIGDQDDSPLRSPIGVTEDDGGHLYITDSVVRQIFVYDIAGKALKPFTTKKLGRPTGIAYNRVNGLLYVSDTSEHQIVVYDLSGAERQRIGSPGNEAGLLNYPTDISVDAKGQVYVTDALNYKIKIFSPEGYLVSQFGTAGDSAGDLNKPKGISVDSEGHIYVCDALMDAVQVFDDTGRLLLVFGDTGTRKGEFWMPSGIYIDRRNYIFVADTYNRRVQIFRYIKDGFSDQDDVEVEGDPYSSKERFREK